MKKSLLATIRDYMFAIATCTALLLAGWASDSNAQVLYSTAGNASGRSHHKSLSDKHFEEVVVVPACGEAFVFDPDLVGRFVLEHDQSGLS